MSSESVVEEPAFVEAGGSGSARVEEEAAAASSVPPPGLIAAPVSEEPLERTILEAQENYHTYVRTRPDYLLVNPRPLPRTAHVYAVRPKPDMAFVVPRALLHTWYEGMDTACVPYGGNECCIEYVHRMFASTKVWTQEGGIVRNRNSITYSTIRERPLNSRLRCNITGVPHTWP